MTDVPKPIEVTCPRCHKTFETYNAKEWPWRVCSECRQYAFGCTDEDWLKQDRVIASR